MTSEMLNEMIKLSHINNKIVNCSISVFFLILKYFKLLLYNPL